MSLCDSGVILKELEQNSNFSVKSEGIDEGANPLFMLYKINTYMEVYYVS